MNYPSRLFTRVMWIALLTMIATSIHAVAFASDDERIADAKAVVTHLSKGEMDPILAECSDYYKTKQNAEKQIKDDWDATIAKAGAYQGIDSVKCVDFKDGKVFVNVKCKCEHLAVGVQVIYDSNGEILGVSPSKILPTVEIVYAHDPVATAPTEKGITADAKAVATHISKGEIDDVIAEYDDFYKKNGNEDAAKIRKDWAALIDDAGAFKSVDSADFKKFGASMRSQVTCTCEHYPILVIVLYDSDAKILRLSFSKAPDPHS